MKDQETTSLGASLNRDVMKIECCCWKYDDTWNIKLINIIESLRLWVRVHIVYWEKVSWPNVILIFIYENGKSVICECFRTNLIGKAVPGCMAIWYLNESYWSCSSGVVTAFLLCSVLSGSYIPLVCRLDIFIVTGAFNWGNMWCNNRTCKGNPSRFRDKLLIWGLKFNKSIMLQYNLIILQLSVLTCAWLWFPSWLELYCNWLINGTW